MRGFLVKFIIFTRLLFVMSDQPSYFQVFKKDISSLFRHAWEYSPIGRAWDKHNQAKAAHWRDNIVVQESKLTLAHLVDDIGKGIIDGFKGAHFGGSVYGAEIDFPSWIWGYRFHSGYETKHMDADYIRALDPLNPWDRLKFTAQAYALDTKGRKHSPFARNVVYMTTALTTTAATLSAYAVVAVTFSPWILAVPVFAQASDWGVRETLKSCRAIEELDRAIFD